MSSLINSAKNKIVGHRRSRSSDINNDNEQQSHVQQDTISPIAQTTPAWHVHSPPANVTSDASKPSSPSKAGQTSTYSDVLPGNSQPAHHVTATPIAASIVKSVPSRNSSLRSKDRHEARHRRKSEQRPELERIDSDSVHTKATDDMHHSTSDAKYYLNRKPLPIPKDDDELETRIQNLSLQQDGRNDQTRSNAEPPVPSTQDHSPLTGKSYARNGTSGSAPQIKGNMVTQNARQSTQPAGFHLQDSSHTIVDEIVRPAVTREVVHRNVKEIQQQVITRDVHIHHYYTYIQPVKVVEVLPAKHYVLDPLTGLKTEIPAPHGWEMPPGLEPHIPDISGISASSRHYLVNEEHPQGVLEPAPQGYQNHTGPGLTNDRHVRPSVPV